MLRGVACLLLIGSLAACVRSSYWFETESWFKNRSEDAPNYIPLAAIPDIKSDDTKAWPLTIIKKYHENHLKKSQQNQGKAKMGEKIQKN